MWRMILFLPNEEEENDKEEQGNGDSNNQNWFLDPIVNFAFVFVAILPNDAIEVISWTVLKHVVENTRLVQHGDGNID